MGATSAGAVMSTRAPDPESLTRQLRGRQVSHVSTPGLGIGIHFTDGATLLIEPDTQGLLATVERPKAASNQYGARPQPTRRQFEYLAFIAKYSHRFGRAPAESDIQRHFLVSAPSVNQMMQSLERRGFITKQPGVPRSARICIDLPGLQLYDTDR